MAAHGRQRRLGIRGRVVASFVLLLSVAVLISVAVLQQVGTSRIDRQADRDLATAADDLRARLAEVATSLGAPGGPTLDAVFDRYLQARPARGDQAFLAIVAGEPYAASAGEPVRLERLPEVAAWAAERQTSRGTLRSTAGPVRWLAVPVRSGGAVLGVLVATQFLAPQQQALRSTVLTESVVMVLVLLGACLLAWGAAGRALSPLRELATAAGSVTSGDDLGARVAVDGRDEVADLATSFNGMLDDLQTAFDSQREFLDQAAHELRTPITIARGHVELLPDDDPAEQRASAALVLDELDRMSRLVEELRVLARSARPDFLAPDDVALDELVTEVGRKAEALAPRRWRLVADDSAVVSVDRQRLTQALLNLVDNAVHATSEGDVIELGASTRGDDTVLWVRDEGAGIAAEDLPTLFDRTGRAIRRRPGGTGLGLPLVAAIARGHGGEARATSTLGAGSCIELVLPNAVVGGAEWHVS